MELVIPRSVLRAGLSPLLVVRKSTMATGPVLTLALKGGRE
jgi:hypothetical protein